MDEAVRTLDSQNYKRNISTDVILELRPNSRFKESQKGVLDRAMFAPEGNKLHAIMDKETCLWHLKYDGGLLPETLRQRFTGWRPLYKFVSQYFNKRNIDIVEIKD